jgi:hypothetical protein
MVLADPRAFASEYDCEEAESTSERLPMVLTDTTGDCPLFDYDATALSSPHG